MQHGEGRDRAQLPLLLRDDLATVELPREEHAELARQVLVDLLPRLEPRAALHRVEEHLRGGFGALPELFVHRVTLLEKSIVVGPRGARGPARNGPTPPTFGRATAKPRRASDSHRR